MSLAQNKVDIEAALAKTGQVADMLRERLGVVNDLLEDAVSPKYATAYRTRVSGALDTVSSKLLLLSTALDDFLK